MTMSVLRARLERPTKFEVFRFNLPHFYKGLRAITLAFSRFLEKVK